jgi:hypothetical protein
MAKIKVMGSAYRVARGKAEIARDEKWLKTAKLTTKKNQELKKHEHARKGIESLNQGKATELTGPDAPDNNKKP